MNVNNHVRECSSVPLSKILKDTGPRAGKLRFYHDTQIGTITGRTVNMVLCSWEYFNICNVYRKYYYISTCI
jgi:hypothetical protein